MVIVWDVPNTPTESFFSPLMNIPWKFHALIRPLKVLPLSYPTNMFNGFIYDSQRSPL